MSQYIEVTPAYGRDYHSQKAVAQAWKDGKDFVIASVEHGPGRYINKDDAPKGATILLRYKKLTKVTPMKVR